MSYTLALSDDGRYIILTIEGNITRQLGAQYSNKAYELGNELGINRYLVDLINCRNTDSITANYDFAYKDIKDGPNINKQSRVAFLVSPGDHSHDFVETVCRNAGLHVTIFNDREAAIRHLVNDPP